MSSSDYFLVGALRNVKEDKECIRRAGDFLFYFSFVEKNKEQEWNEAGKGEGRRDFKKV